MPVKIVFVAKWMTHKTSSLMLKMEFFTPFGLKINIKGECIFREPKVYSKIWNYSWSRVHKRVKIPKPVKVGLGSIRLELTTFTA
jgi:hypothetical protein